MATDSAMKWKLSTKYYFIAGIISILLAVYAMYHVTCLIMLPDEFGYLANAAAMLGWDWSEISSLHSYYSFGYSFLLLPILKYIEDPDRMYRVSILLNFVMVFGHACILYRLIRSFFPRAEGKSVACISAAGACYSGLVAYASLNMTEVLLNVVFLCILCSMKEFLEQTDWKRAVWLSVLLVYLFTVHMRTIAVPIAALLTVLLFCLGDKKKRKYLFIVMSVLLVTVCAAAVLKVFLEGGLYRATPQEMLAWNGLSGQWKKIAGLFTLKGFRNLCFGVAGKLFYLGNATFFTFYWGMLFLGKKAYGLVGRKGRGAKQELIYLFILLCVIGTFLVTAIYLGGGGRIDGIVYGRYNEMVVPVVICLGLAEMLRNPSVMKGTALFIAFHSLCIWVIDYAVNIQGLTAFQGYMSIGIAFAVNEDKALISGITRGPFIICSILAVLLAAGIYFIRRKKNNSMYGLLLLAAVFLSVAFTGAKTYFYPHGSDNAADIELAEELMKELAGRPLAEVYYYHQGNTEYVDNLQLVLREKSIRVAGPKEEPGPEDFVIVYQEDERNMPLAFEYNTVLKNKRFCIYYQD